MVAGVLPTSETLEKLADEVSQNLDGISSILLCAAHQQRIADDILNVSRLKMGILTIQKVPFSLVLKMQEVVRSKHAVLLGPR